MRNTALLPYPQHINIRPNTYSGGLPFDRTLMYQAIRGKLNDYGREGTGAQAAADKDDELFRLLGIKPENNGKPAPQVQTSEDDEMDKYFGYKKSVTVANGGGSARMVNGNDFPEHNSTAIIASDADLLKYLGIKPERTAGYSKPVELTDEPQARGVNQVPVSEALENLYPFITNVSPLLVDKPVDMSVPPSMRNQQLNAMTSLNSTPIGWQPNAWIYGSDSDPLLDFISKAKSGALASVGSLVASLGALMENAPVMTTISNGAIVDDPSLLDVVQKNLGKVLHKAGSSWRDDSRADLSSLTEGNTIKVPFYGDLPTSSIYEGVFDPTNYIPLGAGARVVGKTLTTLKNILKQGAKAGAFSAGVGAAQIYGDDSLTPEEKRQHVVLDGLVGLGLGGISSSMLKARAKVPGILNEHPILKITGEQGIKEIENSPILRSTFAALSKNPELIEHKDVRTVVSRMVYKTSGADGVDQLNKYIAQSFPRKRPDMKANSQKALNNNPKPIEKPKTGTKDRTAIFGKAFPEYNNKPTEAIEHLLKEQGGYVPAAMYREGIGDIAFIWGKGGRKGYGLAHAIERRNSEGLDGVAFVRSLPDLIRNGKVKAHTANEVILELSDREAVIVLNWEGEDMAWVLTTYRKYD